VGQICPHYDDCIHCYITTFGELSDFKMLYKIALTGAIALGFSAALGFDTSAHAQALPTANDQPSQPSTLSSSLTSSSLVPSSFAISPSADQLVSQSPETAQSPTNPQDPSQPGESLDDDTIDPLVEDVAGETAAGTPVRFYVRLNTELYTNGGDLVEFMLPVRYNPSDRLALEAVPVIKYFPESADEEFDYGIKFAVEYQL
jgi:hypothetical protein